MLLSRRGSIGPTVTSGMGLAPTADGRLGINMDVVRAPTSEAAAAAFEEAWERSPLQSVLRMSELNRAMEQSPGRRQARVDLADVLAGESLGTARFEDFYTPETEPEAEMLAPNAASELYPTLSLTFPGPVTREYVDTVAQLRRAELTRQLVMSRASGFGSGAAMFAAELIGSMADPINIVASFIPVVGQARFFRLAERLGASGARAVRGGIEGAVGAALVEPVVLASARRQQSDYGVADSLLNIAFGTFVGGGLHVAGGLAGDVSARFRGRPDLRERMQIARTTEGWEGLAATVEALPIPARREFLRAATAQLVNGRRVDVARALDTLPSVQRLRQTVDRLRPAADAAPEPERAPQAAAEQQRDASVLPDVARDEVTTVDLRQRPTLRDALSLPERPQRAEALVINHGPLAARPEDGVTQIDIDRLPRALIEAQAQEAEPGGEQTVRFESRGREITAVVRPSQDGGPVVVDVAAGGREMPQDIQADAGNVVDFPRRATDPMAETITPQGEAVRAADPAGDAVGDIAASREVSELLEQADDEAKTAAEELQDFGSQVDALRQTGELDAEDLEALAAADTLADEARKLGDTYIASAFCLSGRAA